MGIERLLMIVKDPGHIYEMRELGSDETQTLRFIKRSGGAIHYEKEWPGLQTQEVIRALIARTQYLYDIIPCVETGDAIWHLRMALFMYEVRAWRRKWEEKNKTEHTHDDTERAHPWRDCPYSEVPFNEQGIEKREIGEDGHILVGESTIGG